jgi:hypothetical protein
MTSPLRILLANPKGDPSAELLQTADEALKHLENLHQSNLLLLQGWDSRDQAKWQEAWRIRNSMQSTPTGAAGPT